jgi:hypothetical protein
MWSCMSVQNIVRPSFQNYIELCECATDTETAKPRAIKGRVKLESCDVGELNSSHATFSNDHSQFFNSPNVTLLTWKSYINLPSKRKKLRESSHFL